MSRRQTWAIVVKPSLTQSNSSVFCLKTVILHLSTTTIQRWWSSFPHKCTEYTISTSIPLTNSSMVINLGASSYANCVHVNEHLKWDEHIKNTLAACCATVWVLEKAQTRGNISNKNNQLVEKLILSKLNYVELVYYPLPHFLLQRLQRVQFCGSEFCSWKVH